LCTLVGLSQMFLQARYATESNEKIYAVSCKRLTPLTTFIN